MLRLGSIARLKHFAFALFVAVAATGCKQGLGERCQVPEDCESGYCFLPTNDRIAGGVCDRLPTGDGGTGDASVNDLTATLDATSID